MFTDEWRSSPIELLQNNKQHAGKQLVLKPFAISHVTFDTIRCVCLISKGFIINSSLYMLSNYASGSANVYFKNKTTFQTNIENARIVVVLWEKLNICKWYRRETKVLAWMREKGQKGAGPSERKLWKLHTSDKCTLLKHLKSSGDSEMELFSQFLRNYS